MTLLLKVSLHLIHNGVPCLLVLWCFQRATPLTVVARTPRPGGSFLRMQVCSPGAEQETTMTLPLELCGRERAGDSEANRAAICSTEPLVVHSYLHYNSVFIIHISCGILAWKRVISLHGGGQVMAASQVAWLTTSRGGGRLFWNSKHQNSPLK